MDSMIGIPSLQEVSRRLCERAQRHCSPLECLENCPGSRSVLRTFVQELQGALSFSLVLCPGYVEVVKRHLRRRMRAISCSSSVADNWQVETLIDGGLCPVYVRRRPV